MKDGSALLVASLDIEDEYDPGLAVVVDLAGLGLRASLRKAPRRHRQRAGSQMAFPVADREREGQADPQPASGGRFVVGEQPARRLLPVGSGEVAKWWSDEVSAARKQASMSGSIAVRF